jgi:hypothetical protein
MSRTVVIEFPDEATDQEINTILDSAQEQARKYALNCRLRTQNPDTRRYVWHRIAGAIETACRGE